MSSESIWLIKLKCGFIKLIFTDLHTIFTVTFKMFWKSLNKVPCTWTYFPSLRNFLKPNNKNRIISFTANYYTFPICLFFMENQETILICKSFKEIRSIFATFRDVYAKPTDNLD